MILHYTLKDETVTYTATEAMSYKFDSPYVIGVSSGSLSEAGKFQVRLNSFPDVLPHPQISLGEELVNADFIFASNS